MTLEQLSFKARVPVEFAREANHHGLLAPNDGLVNGQPVYRSKLAGWLSKLKTMRNAGFTWDEIAAWTKRRWQPSHEHERLWPASVKHPLP